MAPPHHSTPPLPLRRRTLLGPPPPSSGPLRSPPPSSGPLCLPAASGRPLLLRPPSVLIVFSESDLAVALVFSSHLKLLVIWCGSVRWSSDCTPRVYMLYQHRGHTSHGALARDRCLSDHIIYEEAI